MSVYVDTSGLIAVLDARDRHHEAAKRAWAHLLAGDEPLVCTSYVLVVAFAVIQRRLGVAAVRAFHEEICPALSVEWVDRRTHQMAADAVLAAGRRHLSLVDCVSFEVMRRSGIEEAFCFDSHFSEAGFQNVT